MLVQVKKWGHSLAFRIPTTVARDTHLEENAWADVQLTRVDTAPVYDLDELVAKITPENRHGEIGGHYAVGKEI